MNRARPNAVQLELMNWKPHLTPPEGFTFYLGTHQVNWVARFRVNFYLSRSRWFERETLPVALADGGLDSEGFTRLSRLGSWAGLSAKQWASEARRARDEMFRGAGRLRIVSIQDWMCEPWVLTKTGLSLDEHLERTVASYLELRAIDPGLPWLPVIQGWKLADYMRCVELYDRQGVDLRQVPVVGLGSVCRRENTDEAEEIARRLHAMGLRLHGFGFKTRGLRRVWRYFASADSMAWSDGARHRDETTTECKHGKLMPRKRKGGARGYGNCSNCELYALRWRNRVLEQLTTQAGSEKDT